MNNKYTTFLTKWLRTFNRFHRRLRERPEIVQSPTVDLPGHVLLHWSQVRWDWWKEPEPSVHPPISSPQPRMTHLPNFPSSRSLPPIWPPSICNRRSSRLHNRSACSANRSVCYLPTDRMRSRSIRVKLNIWTGTSWAAWIFGVSLI